MAGVEAARRAELSQEAATRFPGVRAEPAGAWLLLRTRADHWHAVHAWLRHGQGLRYLASLAAVHWVDEGEFEVATHLLGVEDNGSLTQRVSVRTRVGDGEGTALPSLTDLWDAADWLERQVWDMFGIRFTGHPDLRRIWMWPGYDRHPLRKDFTDTAPNLGVSESTLAQDREVGG